MADRSVKILFAAGGTGGHLFPALAVADELRKLRSDADILFVGTRTKIEARIVPAEGYRFRTIWVSPLHRDFRLSNVLFIIKAVVALFQSFFLVRRFSPDIVVGTGGYVAGPVLWVSSMLGVTTVVHESNSYPGVTTRLLSRRASKLFVSFEVTKKWLRRDDNVEVVGNPTRNVLGMVSREEGSRFFNVDPSRKTLLVFGGSLGAASINNAIAGVVSALVEAGIQVIWQAGEMDFERVSRLLRSEVPSHGGAVWIGKFIDRMEYAYAAADLVVCRAGATTLAELTRLGKPAILVPYPHASADHQAVNARTLVEHGAAEMILDQDINTRAGEGILELMLDSRKLKRMSEKSHQLGKPGAAAEMARKILTLVHR